MIDLGRIRVTDVFGGVILNARFIRGGGADSTRIRVEAPGFRPRSLFLDYSTTTVDEVIMTMKNSEAGPGNLSSMCFRNIETACLNVFLRDCQLWDYLGSLQMIHQDRLWIDAQHRLPEALEESPQWDHAPGILHSSPRGGWERQESWKLNRVAPVLQITMHKRLIQCPLCRGDGTVAVPGEDATRATAMDAGTPEPQGLPVHGSGPCTSCEGRSLVTEWMAEIDLDLKSGVGHWFEVLGNHATGKRTNPHEVAQALYVGWGIESYLPEPGGHA